MAITDTDVALLISQRLRASASVSALVSTRVRPDTLNLNEAMPAIRYEVLSGESWKSLDGGGREGTTRLQIDCYADTRTQANQLAEAVRSNLDGFRGLLGQTFINDCVVDNLYDRVDRPEPGSEEFRRRRTLDFVITHTQPTPALTG